MKKKIFGSIVVLAIAAIVAFNVNLDIKNDVFSTVLLGNIEALATPEIVADKGCTPKIETNSYYGRCSSWDRNKYFNYSVTRYSCDSGGESYLCELGSVYSGYDCNNDNLRENSSTTIIKCK